MTLSASTASTLITSSLAAFSGGQAGEPNYMIRFPFWLVIPQGLQVSPDNQCDEGHLPLVFASAPKVANYLGLRQGGNWDVRLVNRYTATESMAVVRQHGFDAVCVDIQDDGTGGVKIGTTDFLANLDSK